MNKTIVGADKPISDLAVGDRLAEFGVVLTWTEIDPAKVGSWGEYAITTDRGHSGAYPGFVNFFVIEHY